jgi:type IV secretion system protein VirD4
MSKVHFILDEAAALGVLEPVNDALDVGRGYGIRLLFCYQSLGQLKKCFPEGQDQTLLSNTTQIFFGVNDNATADYVSTRLGDSTIVVESGGTSSGSSYQLSQGMQSQTSKGDSYNSSQNWAQQARRLLKPEEVMSLPARTAITFTSGVPPIATTLVRYYEEKHLGNRMGCVRHFGLACLTLLMSAVVCAGAALIADAVTEQIDQVGHSSYAIPAQQQQWPQSGRIPYGKRTNY